MSRSITLILVYFLTHTAGFIGYAFWREYFQNPPDSSHSLLIAFVVTWAAEGRRK